MPPSTTPAANTRTEILIAASLLAQHATTKLPTNPAVMPLLARSSAAAKRGRAARWAPLGAHRATGSQDPAVVERRLAGVRRPVAEEPAGGVHCGLCRGPERGRRSVGELRLQDHRVGSGTPECRVDVE